MDQGRSDRVAYYLAVWRDWMRQKPDELGYPDHAIPFSDGYTAPRNTDEYGESLDVLAGAAMDAIISGLQPYQSCAVHHFNLSAVWRFQRIRVEDAYADALAEIALMLPKKGLT